MTEHIVRKHSFKRLVVGVTLILGCCFISNTNAECVEPPTYHNAYLQWNSDTGAVGSSVVYSCNDGYQMFGSADYIVRVCSSEGEWTGPVVDCTEKVSCPLPPSPAFGWYNVTEEGLRFQSSVTFQCQAGYTLDGPENITCTASGEWKMEDDSYIEPICKHLCTQDHYRYRYHECYERKDKTGDWDTAKLSCENDGGQLATIKDTAQQLFIENILEGYSSFYWIGGYELDRDWKYSSDEQYATYFNWAPGEPSTSEENCVYLSNVNGEENSLKWNDEFCRKSIVDTTPQTPIYSICETEGNCITFETSSSKHQYENTCLFFLDDESRSQYSSKTKCGDDFAGKLVEIKSQNMQDFIENVINGNGFQTANWWIGLEEGFERTWSWVDGERIETFFWADGEPSHSSEKCLDILTTKDYKWNDDNCVNSDRKYICQHGVPKCGNPGTPSHGSMTSSKESYSVGETIYFSCNNGYIISDPLMESLTCQNDSTWSGSVPFCQKINCSYAAPNIPSTTSYPVSTVYRGIIVYECLDGNYVLNGYPVSVCQENGTWSNPNITCTEILTTRKYTTAPLTTSVTIPELSTDSVLNGQTTEAIGGTKKSSLSPSTYQTEVLDGTETIQPITVVDLTTLHDDFLTDSGASEVYKKKTTNLGSTQRSVTSSTKRDILTSELSAIITELETKQSSNSAFTSDSITSTQSLTPSIMFDDVSTGVTDLQQHTSVDQADLSTTLVNTEPSRDAPITSGSFTKSLPPLFTDYTYTSPVVEVLTTLEQSTETLHTVVTNTDDLEQTPTQIFPTNVLHTTKMFSTFSSEPSVQTNSLPSSDITTTPSQDSLVTGTFSSIESPTAISTVVQKSTSSITAEFQSAYTYTFKITQGSLPTSQNSFPTTNQRLPETTKEKKSFTTDLSSFPESYLTSTELPTTDTANLITKLLSSDRPSSSFSEELTTHQGMSTDTPLPTKTTLNYNERTEYTRTKNMSQTKATDEVYTILSSPSTSFQTSTPRPAERPSSSPSNSLSPTSEPGRSEKLSENYSQEPETTQEPSNKGLIIGVSVTSAVIGVGICVWLMLFVVFEKYPGLINKRNKVHPTDDDQESNTEKGQNKTRKEESVPEYTTLPLTEIPNDAKPYLYNSNESIEYI